MNEIHMIGSVICSVIALIIFGILIYSTIRLRSAKSADAAHFHGSLLAEMFWTTVAFLIIVALATPAMMVIYQQARLLIG